MAPVIPAALTRELGVADVETGLTGHPYEETAELVWPSNLKVYDRMRRTDGQTRALMLAILYPILATRWRLAGADVRAEVQRAVETDLGLALDEQGRRRTRDGGVSWNEFLRHALLMLVFGHMPFELVFYPPAPTDDIPGLDGRVLARLRKLAPRMPRSLIAIDVARDGGLKAIRQQVPDRRLGVREVSIPVKQLVFFCNEREGADWTGQSILRASYKHWLIKDTLIRLDAMSADRQGMGLPVVTYPQGQEGGRAAALRIARDARVGEDAGVALEEGWTFSLVGVTGGTKDLIGSIKYHEEAQGRSMLAMFLNLGHDNGARSLGDTFVDYFLMACHAVVRQIEEVVTQHVIRDYVRINFGEDEPYPTLIADPLTSENVPTATALKTLADAQLLIPDETLRAEIRRRYGLPPAEEDAAPPPGEPGTGTEPSPSGPLPPPVPSGYTPGTGSPTNEDEVLPPSGVREAVDTSASALAGVTYEAETEAIRAKRGSAEARRPHAFRPAVWTKPNGHPRCAWCGLSERVGGCPGADHDGLVTSLPGSRDVVRTPRPGAYRRDDPRRAGDAAYAEADYLSLVERTERVAHILAGLRDVEVFHLPGRHNQKAHARTIGPGLVSTTRETGGATFDPRAGRPVTSGSVVATDAPSKPMAAEEFFTDEDAAVASMRDYVRQNQGRLDANPETHLGLWHDEESGKVVFDIVEVTDRETAVRLGRQRNEKAIFDLDTGEEIETGGAGRYSEGTPWPSDP